jgi:hypothetical protein
METGSLLKVFLFLFSLLFFSPLWISARYKWRQHGLLPPPLAVEFPRAPDPPKGHL